MSGPSRPPLHLITDSRQTREVLLRVAVAAVEGGVDAIQVRAKDAPAKELAELLIVLRLRSSRPVLLLVNGHLELVTTGLADGVHLSERDRSRASARSFLGPNRYLGVSVHSQAAARRAHQEGASSVTFGHVYPTASHPGEPARGLDRLRQVAAAVPIPVLAIGGVTAARVPDLLAAGATGVAVISAISGAADPRAAARALRLALDGAGTAPRPPVG